MNFEHYTVAPQNTLPQEIREYIVRKADSILGRLYEYNFLILPANVVKKEELEEIRKRIKELKEQSYRIFLETIEVKRRRVLGFSKNIKYLVIVNLSGSYTAGDIVEFYTEVVRKFSKKEKPIVVHIHGVNPGPTLSDYEWAAEIEKAGGILLFAYNQNIYKLPGRERIYGKDRTVE